MRERNQKAAVIAFVLIAASVVLLVVVGVLVWFGVQEATRPEPMKIKASIRQVPESVLEDAPEATTVESDGK